VVNIETICYILSVPFLYRFRYNCQINVGYYVALLRFISYIENSPCISHVFSRGVTYTGYTLWLKILHGFDPVLELLQVREMRQYLR